LLVRYGGDEFVVLLPGTTKEQALLIAERVRLGVNGQTGDGSDSMIRIPLAISVGVAERREHGTLDTLSRDADAALYRAKDSGRNAVSD
jgi:diguanylate cyclase (GGDEF)-like protein